MYLQIAQRSPRLMAAMNCVSTIVSTSTFASCSSRAKRLFSVASEIGLPSLPLMRRQTRSCAIPHATRSLTTARSSSIGTNGGLPTVLLEGSLLPSSLLFLMLRSVVFELCCACYHQPVANAPHLRSPSETRSAWSTAIQPKIALLTELLCNFQT